MEFSRSLEMFSQARQLIPGGSQTNSKRPQNFAYGVYPIYIERGLGCRVTDVDGNTFIDLVGALGPINLGYGYPRVNRAIEEQLGRGIVSGLLFPAELEAARLITEVVPCAEMVRFFKGGGEATAAAARIARKYTGRELILNCGYRGWPDVWTAARNDGGVPTALESSIRTFPFNDIEALERLFAEHKDQVAAVFLDILHIEPKPGYLEAVIDLAHANGALFVMDEIVSGFRLATGGAQEYFGVVPDMACFAKGIANGMPLSAVVGKAEVMREAENLLISITYGGEALSLAAAIATMSELREKKVTDYLWEIGRTLMNGLDNAAKKHGVPFECYGLPPMSLMRFRDVDAQGNQLVWGYFLQEMAARGVLMRRGGVNFVSYSHRPQDIAEVIAAADEVFANLAPLWGTPQLAEHVHILEFQTSFRSFA
ncbi:MAG: aminotransferase class III-fold pyridoxal phosphate-dependent enzyme [Firmicutes bacterium]|jgi:glutamate-1-semialdehyde aminotransferase|nr:aminotransferase class III-fold pyridoxal phosphate-dependent enzyme [Bacillota bacterium]